MCIRDRSSVTDDVGDKDPEEDILTCIPTYALASQLSCTGVNNSEPGDTFSICHDYNLDDNICTVVNKSEPGDTQNTLIIMFICNEDDHLMDDCDDDLDDNTLVGDLMDDNRDDNCSKEAKIFQALE